MASSFKPGFHMNAVPISLSDKFYDLCLRFNRRLETITQKLEPPLHINENHILAELIHHKSGTAKDIAATLHLEKSVVSRSVDSLIKRGLIEAASSPSDGRVKYLTITGKGRVFFEKDSEMRSTQVKEFFSPLTRVEQLDLARYLGLVADKFNSPPIPSLPTDPPGKAEIRRITRTLGVLGTSFLGTGLPIEKCQILSLLSSSGREISVGSLKKTLPYDAPVLSRLLASLEENELIARARAHAADGRQVDVKLTDGGYHQDIQNRRVASRALVHALSDVEEDSLNHLVSLLSKMLSNEVFEERHLTTALRFAEIKDESERRLARGFLMEELVRTKRHFDAPEVLIGSKNPVVGIFSGSVIRGVIEGARVKSSWRVVNSGFKAECSEEERGKLLLALLKKLSKRASFTSLIIPSDENFSFLGGILGKTKKGDLEASKKNIEDLASIIDKKGSRDD